MWVWKGVFLTGCFAPPEVRTCFLCHQSVSKTNKSTVEMRPWFWAPPGQCDCLKTNGCKCGKKTVLIVFWQMTLGISRDDAGAFVPECIASGVCEADPFVTIDAEGVGFLVRKSGAAGRSASADLSSSVCGEHGGDPASVAFFDSVGLNWVSCSPFRSRSLASCCKTHERWRHHNCRRRRKKLLKHVNKTLIWEAPEE